MKKKIVGTLAALLCSLMGCSPQIMDGDGMVNSYKQISQEEAAEMMAKDDGHVVVTSAVRMSTMPGTFPGPS